MGYHKVASSAFSEDAESEAYDLYLYKKRAGIYCCAPVPIGHNQVAI
jgi:hypothetical protein